MTDRDFKLDRRIKAKSVDYVYDLHNYDVDLENNHIYLFGVDRGYEVVEGTEEPGVDYVMANRFIRNMNLCMRRNAEKPLVIHLKSCGGDWQEGMAIYDMIKSYPWPVTILSYTHARSMTSIISQAANKRVTMPHGIFMFHEGDMGIYGTQKQVQSYIDFYAKTTPIMTEIYIASMREKGVFKNDSERRRWVKDQMNKLEDVYLNAQQAIDMGFFDETFNGNWESLTTYTNDQLKR